MRNPAPGGALLHPLTIAALLLLVLNDHFLKQVCPGVVTGKLSDFAGVLLLPVFLHASVELFAARLGTRLAPTASERALVVCVVIASLAFALPEVWAPADFAYRHGLAAGQWPVRALSALLSGRDLPGLVPVRATPDVTDLLALPMAFVALGVASPRAKRDSRGDQGAAPRNVAMTAETPRVGSSCVQV